MGQKETGARTLDAVRAIGRRHSVVRILPPRHIEIGTVVAGVPLRAAPLDSAYYLLHFLDLKTAPAARLEYVAWP